MLQNWLDNSPKETLVCAAVSVVSLILSITGALPSLPIDPAWIAIILCGTPILIGAFKGVVFDKDIKADLLVSMALVASAATGEYFAAGEVALIMQIGSLLEDYTSERARKNIEKLMDLSPRTARRITNGTECIVPVEEIVPGDVLSVIAGETVPVDGIVTEGETSIDQSVLTGESLPVTKTSGDSVLSGTVNRFGTFRMRCTASCGDSSIQRMAALAKEAEENRAPIVDQADRWATWLVVIALACSIITWAVTGIFMRAVTVLVVFCPCAFILATPTAVLAGIGNAAGHGIIIKSGEALERLAGVKTAAFDKTGTLTAGKPSVSRTVPGPEISEEELLKLAALAEKDSEHPLGRAICSSVSLSDEERRSVTGFRMTPGMGVEASVCSDRIEVGRPGDGDDGASGGETAVRVCRNGEPIGTIYLSDTIRKEAPDTISRLRTKGIRTVMLTGDAQAAESAIAEKTGIDEWHDSLLPADKIALIKDLGKKEGHVCMIGDGVNDAPALAAADACIAMGGIGSDITVEASDAVITGDDIGRIPYIFELTGKVMKKIRVNLTASLLINLSAVILSGLGVLTPVTGALWHNVGSVFVVVNAATLLALKDKRQ